MSSPRMSRLHRILGVLSIVWLVAAPAGVSRADPAEAERIRGAIENAMGSLQWPWKAGGEITVAEIGGAYHVVIPDVTLDPGQELEGEIEGILDLGDVSIVAKPLADDRYHIDLTLANRMSFREPGGEVATLITIGKQRFEGVWAPAFETFIVADAAYEDIWLTVPGSQPMLTVAALTSRINLEESVPGSWSGPSVSKISKLRFEMPESGERFDLGELEIRALCRRDAARRMGPVHARDDWHDRATPGPGGRGRARSGGDARPLDRHATAHIGRVVGHDDFRRHRPGREWCARLRHGPHEDLLRAQRRRPAARRRSVPLQPFGPRRRRARGRHQAGGPWRRDDRDRSRRPADPGLVGEHHRGRQVVGRDAARSGPDDAVAARDRGGLRGVERPQHYQAEHRCAGHRRQRYRRHQGRRRRRCTASPGNST